MIYVDDLGISYKRMCMYHLFAVPHNNKELVEFGEKIGLKKEWLQTKNVSFPHFDVCKSKRKQAISLGATSVSTREMVLLNLDYQNSMKMREVEK